MNDRPARMPLALAIGWGIGTLVPSIMFNTTAFLLLRYMTDYLGIAAATAGLLITASKVYDIVANPLMGQLSDRSRFAAGRRRPWLLIGGGLAAASYVMLFNAPDTGTLAFVGIALLAYATGYTAFNVPYLAMPAEMTGDYHERSWLISFRVYAIAIGTFVGGSLAPMLIEWTGGGEQGHRRMAWILAVPIVLSALTCFWMTRHARFTTPPPKGQVPAGSQLRLIAENRPFAWLVATKFLQLFALVSGQATMSYFVVRVLGFSYTQLGLYTLAGAAAIFGSQPFWLALSRRRGKSRTYTWAAAGYALLTLSWFLAGPGEPALLYYGRALAFGFLSGGLLLMGQALLPDTIEYDYLKSGLRREGLFAGVYSMAEKLAGAMGATVTGLILGAMGYVAARGRTRTRRPGAPRGPRPHGPAAAPRG